LFSGWINYKLGGINMSDSTIKTSFSRIKLRTKIKDPVVSTGITPREIIFSNEEKTVYIKDLDGNVYAFIPVNDNIISKSSTWSSDKINSEMLGIDLTIRVIDGGYF
jgi:hypothetical protein